MVLPKACAAVAGDGVPGGRQLRRGIRQRGMGQVLAVSFRLGGQMVAEKLQLPAAWRRDLQRNIMLFRTGATRSTNSILVGGALLGARCIRAVRLGVICLGLRCTPGGRGKQGLTSVIRATSVVSRCLVSLKSHGGRCPVQLRVRCKPHDHEQGSVNREGRSVLRWPRHAHA